jgi:plasmid replication initiation protein
MDKIDKNLEVIQSYILTSAKYNFSVYEKRILYQLVNLAQHDMDGKKLNKDYALTSNLFNEKIIEMPINAFKKDDLDQNHTKIKAAFISLKTKQFIYEDEECWTPLGIVEKVKLYKKRGMVKFEIMPEIWAVILNFTKGFNKFELEIAMKFKSVFTMRFYELFANNLNPMTLTIDQLKERFQVVDKYTQTADFIKRVVLHAKTELDAVAPVSFNYALNRSGNKITSITFVPYEIEDNQTPALVKNKLEKSTSLRWTLPKHILEYFYFLGFEKKGIRANMDDLRIIQEKDDLMNLLSKLKASSEGKNSKQGYIMGALKTRAKQLRENVNIDTSERTAEKNNNKKQDYKTPKEGGPKKPQYQKAKEK